MNILYTVTWPDPASEETPRQFYDQLRASVARGARFPFDCPYEIALVHASNTPDITPPPALWAVAVLANSVSGETIGNTEQTIPRLEAWFQQWAPSGIPTGASILSRHATHLKLASELRPDYDIVANFGTFVGEPELEPAPEVAKTPPPLSRETEALKVLAGQPLSPEAQKVLGAPPVAAAQKPSAVQPAPSRPAPAISDTASTCLGIGLMITGIILIPVSLVLGGLLAIGQYATDPATASTAGSTSASTAEFIFYLACCPFPVLILGIGIIFLGIYIPRWIKQTQSLPVTPPKG